jgi:hypothetical protein
MKSIDIWKERYEKNPELGSGNGSKGELLNFKVNFLNSFIEQNNIKSVLDFGHGDLSVANKLLVDSYTGIDIFNGDNFNIKKLKIKKCRFDAYEDESADLVICLDVLYHILEDEQTYMHHAIDKMIEKSNKYIIIYAHDSLIDNYYNSHLFDSKWMQYIRKNEDIVLIFTQSDCQPGCSAKFFVFKKNFII